ncbi:MAG: hypothetical protein MJB14_15140 [Spirochaetes bacterium]|nr:hypothetical protein [Spirochaetota bacterium]
MKKKSVKVQIPDFLFETIKETAQCEKMNLSEYVEYLIYKENYLHLSINSLHQDKPFQKFYQKYLSEIEEKDLWSTMFNFSS